jgi:hypothetical protein
MAGLVPAIHVFVATDGRKDVDARDKRGHDGRRWVFRARWFYSRPGMTKEA